MENPGVALGTMTTVWEQCDWKMALLGTYATARWTHNPDLPLDRLLADFSKDLLGEKAPKVGKAWYHASNEDYRLRILGEALSGPRSPQELALLKPEVEARTQRLAKDAQVLAEAKASINPDLGRYLNTPRPPASEARAPAPARRLHARSAHPRPWWTPRTRPAACSRPRPSTATSSSSSPTAASPWRSSPSSAGRCWSGPSWATSRGPR